MIFAIFRRCILSNSGGNVNFDICKKIVSAASLISQNTAVSVKRQNFKPNPCSVESKFIHNNQVFRKNVDQSNVKGIHENFSALRARQGPLRKKKSVTATEKLQTPGTWNVKSLSTAEEYNLEALMQGIVSQELYTASTIYEGTCSMPNVIHAVAKYEIGNEPRQIFFFREGSVVMWNICDLEEENILQFLKKYEDGRYSNELVQSESELMTYTYTDSGKRSHLKDGDIVLAADATTLDKYTFSNAMAQSVKLGIWEASLNRYVNSIEFVTEDLKTGRKLRMTQQEVLRKQGELFALRHLINLSSDLLDTPDFYWERDDLENLYQQICGYFSIAKRTRVMNEKLNHCVELIGILSSHLSDRHHIRLEWMIIILIMVEVAFEILHYIDRYLVK